MKPVTTFIIKLFTSLGMVSFASLASAGSAATITYGPGATSVPTMGGTMLIALAVLLALVAFRLLKDRAHSGSSMVIAIAAVTALASGAGGVKLIADAHANSNVLEMDSESGGVISIPEPGSWVISNPTDVDQSINKIDYAPGCGPGMVMISEPAVTNGAVPVASCSTSTTLAGGGSETCEIAVSCEFDET